MKPILELRGLSKSFGGLQVIQDLDLVVGAGQIVHDDDPVVGRVEAVDDLDLTIAPGEIVSVIGPNGAGKTTLFNLITGIYQPDSGDILMDGRSIVGLSSEAIANLGIGRTFQTLRVFLNMTVKENVMAAAYGDTSARLWQSVLRTPAARREERQIADLAERKLAFFGDRLMGYRWDQPAYSLSYANRRRLEIARAMATNPRLLMLDEPAAGMNPAETHEMTELIGRLREEVGYSILVIEHDMHVVEGISDRVIALDHGVKITEGTFDEVATDPKVIEAYLGYGAASAK
jgi:ABC-type branched-subunit amino acid transport system ATPase component